MSMGYSSWVKYYCSFQEQKVDFKTTHSVWQYYCQKHFPTNGEFKSEHSVTWCNWLLLEDILFFYQLTNYRDFHQAWIHQCLPESANKNLSLTNIRKSSKRRVIRGELWHLLNQSKSDITLAYYFKAWSRM